MLLSEIVVGLQTQLNSLKLSSSALGLKVNMDKSNAVVFRKGGYLGLRERWFFDGHNMPVYKYLGIFIFTKLSFVASCKDLSSRGKRALVYILQRLNMFQNNSPCLLLKLFYKQVQPIIQYG